MAGQRANQLGIHRNRRAPLIGKFLQRAQGVNAVIGVAGQRARAQQIVFGAFGRSSHGVKSNPVRRYRLRTIATRTNG